MFAIAAEKLPNVTFKFGHKLLDADLDKGSMKFTKYNISIVNISSYIC